MGSRLYFAYGSNLNPARVAERGLTIVGPAKAAALHGFKLHFNKISRRQAGAGHANVMYSSASRVEGVVYECANETEIEKMDPFERYPQDYRRQIVSVWHGSTCTAAWTYLANPSAMADRLYPPRWYLRHMLRARHWLSKSYIAAIQAATCLEDIQTS